MDALLLQLEHAVGDLMITVSIPEEPISMGKSCAPSECLRPAR